MHHVCLRGGAAADDCVDERHKFNMSITIYVSDSLHIQWQKCTPSAFGSVLPPMMASIRGPKNLPPKRPKMDGGRSCRMCEDDNLRCWMQVSKHQDH